MSIPASLLAALQSSLAQALGQAVSIRSHRPVAGGCIHRAHALDTDRGPFFVKFGDRPALPMLEAEVQGLEALARAATLGVASPLATGMSGDHAFLLLHWLPTEPRSGAFWEDFGRGLAGIHRCSGPSFGWEHDNFIGRLPQPNGRHPAFAGLLAARLLAQATRAQQGPDWSPALQRQLERFCAGLADWIPVEPPSLVHGDLWQGNFICSHHGQAFLIDPAVHLGHREAELAFMHLFGGFDRRLFQAYDEAMPLQPGWQARIPRYNLYPLMVHLNLFGPSYLPDIQQILAKWA